MDFIYYIKINDDILNKEILNEYDEALLIITTNEPNETEITDIFILLIKYWRWIRWKYS